MKRAICMKCKAKGEYLDLRVDACKSCGTVGRLAPLIGVVFDPDEAEQEGEVKPPCKGVGNMPLAGELRQPKVTHCRKGHELTPNNLVYTDAGYPECKRCKYDRANSRRKVQRLEAKVIRDKRKEGIGLMQCEIRSNGKLSIILTGDNPIQKLALTEMVEAVKKGQTLKVSEGLAEGTLEITL